MIKKSMLLLLMCGLCMPCNTGMAATGENPTRAALKDKDSCVECHVKLGEKLSEPVRQWRGSAHGRSGRKCSMCHGGNPSMDSKKAAKARKYGFVGIPERKKITAFCGRDGCHKNEISYFSKGPHYTSVLKNGEPGCVSCHSSHEVQISFTEIISDKNCSSCHTADYARKMVSSLRSTRERLHAIQADIDYLHNRQINVPELKSRLKQVTSRFRELLHVFTRESMTTTRSEIDLESQMLKAESGTRVSITGRISLLYIIMIVVGFSSLFTYILYTFFMFMRRR